MCEQVKIADRSTFLPIHSFPFPLFVMEAAASSSTTERLLEPEQNKRIALPIRIEPKVFFANERTFLSWLNFTVVLGGLAIGLLNFGDRVSRMAAALFTVVAMGVMLYSLYTFLWRASKIRKREAAPYDDRVGPTVLCIVLILAVSFNFYCKYILFHPCRA